MLNIVVLIGRLTKDPVLRQTQTGISVTSFSLAVNRGYGEAQTVDFINIVAWRVQAENICKYIGKGSLVAIDGRIQSRVYEDSEGNKKTIVEVHANTVKFLESKSNKVFSSEDQLQQLDNISEATEQVKDITEPSENITKKENIKSEDINFDLDDDTFDITDEDLPF